MTRNKRKMYRYNSQEGYSKLMHFAKLDKAAKRKKKKVITKRDVDWALYRILEIINGNY